MKLIWLSDVHLNFLAKVDHLRHEYYQKIKQAEGNTVLITGDIAESNNVVSYITEMQLEIDKPIYFVLGNHDYYGSSILAVKNSVKHLNYLPKNMGIPLSDSTILIGVDGWGDCRNGDFENSRLVMNDWIHIEDIRKEYGKGMAALKVKLQQLADMDAQKLKRRVNRAIKNGYKHIIIATHVPPFEQSCLYAGRKSTPDGLPFFSSQCLGNAILPIAKRNPKVDFSWFSGHTHSRAKYKPCNNLTSKVAKSEYFVPQIEASIEYD